MSMLISRQVWDAVTRALNEDDITDVRYDYSGRWMFGQLCVGVAGSLPGVAIKFMLAVADELASSDYHKHRDILLEMSDDMCIDDMGLGKIYYFPGWVVER